MRRVRELINRSKNKLGKKVSPAKPTTIKAAYDLIHLRMGNGQPFLKAYRETTKALSGQQKLNLLRTIRVDAGKNSEFCKAINFEISLLSRGRKIS
jgi:hypothetical protein